MPNMSELSLSSRFAAAGQAKGHACRTLLVEGAEASDIAAFLARKSISTPSSSPGKKGVGDCLIAQRHVILLSSDPAVLQCMENQNIHCVDLLGAVRRPEWLQVAPTLQDAVNCGPMRCRKAALAQARAAMARAAKATGEVNREICKNAAAGATYHSILV
jgi:hypothetical protein